MDIADSSLGNGIINADGELWRTHRKAGLQFFSGSSTDTLIEVELPRQFQRTRKTLKEAASSSKLTDLEAVLFDLTTRTMGLMAYGLDIDATSDFATAFDYASGKTGDRFQNPIWQITELINGSKLRAAIREVHRFGKEIVSTAESRYNSEQQKLHHDNKDNSKAQHDEARGTLIESLLYKISDRRIVADSALNFLSAARDTTAQALTWNMYCLMRNPHIIPRIRAEIAQALPNKENLTTSDLQSQHLPYLHAVFNESLRLYPPIPFEIKECFNETTLPDGTFLPAGSIVLWCIWSWNRSPEIWGNEHDVEAYIPERWLEDVDGDNKRKFKGRSAYDFPVFNAGPRACLGRKMAEVLSVWILINIVEEFDFIECSGLEDDGVRERPKEQPSLPPRKTKNSLTLPMEGGLPCRVYLRGK